MAWEYWTPDEEVAEFLAETAGDSRGFDSLADPRTEYKGWNAGLRYGKGNPDNVKFHFGVARQSTRQESPAWRDCKGCGTGFEPSKRNTLYCSTACIPRPGRQRQLPDVTCLVCGVSFRIYYEAQTCCSHVCVGQSQRLAFAREGCRVCGGNIPPSTSNNKTARFYCTTRCKRNAAARAFRAREATKRRGADSGNTEGGKQDAQDHAAARCRVASARRVAEVREGQG